MRRFIFVIALVFLCPFVAVAQQLPLSCEQSLTQAQARLDLVLVSREQGEQVAATALQQARDQIRVLEARLKVIEQPKESRQKEPES